MDSKKYLCKLKILPFFLGRGGLLTALPERMASSSDSRALSSMSLSLSSSITSKSGMLKIPSWKIKTYVLKQYELLNLSIKKNEWTIVRKGTE